MHENACKSERNCLNILLFLKILYSSVQTQSNQRWKSVKRERESCSPRYFLLLDFFPNNNSYAYLHHSSVWYLIFSLQSQVETDNKRLESWLLSEVQAWFQSKWDIQINSLGLLSNHSLKHLRLKGRILTDL